MPNLTDSQRRGLAEFAGLKIYGEHKNWSGWWVHEKDLSGKYPSDRGIFYNKWHPDTDAAQADMVLRALVKDGDLFSIMVSKEGADAGSMKAGPVSSGEWWPGAVCSAALEVMGQKKGGG